MPLVRLVDRFTDRLGRMTSWLALAMVLVGAYNAVVRYLDRWLARGLEHPLSSNTYIELQWYMFSVLFLLGASYALRHDAHVRVDVVYARLSDRGRAWVNLVGAGLFLLPFSLLGLWASWPAVRNSWSIREVSPDAGGLPRYPIKAVLLIAFGLLAVQAVAEIIRHADALRRDGAEPVHRPEGG